MQKIMVSAGTIRKLLLSKVEFLQSNSSYLSLQQLRLSKPRVAQATAYYPYPSNWSQLSASLSEGNSTANSDLDSFNSSFNPSTATIIVVLVVAFFFLIFFSIYARRCSTDDAIGDHNTTRRPAARTHAAPQGLDKALVDKLPIVTYSVGTGSEEAKDVTECVVCLSDFEEKEILRLLPRCGHIFHQECLDMWLSSHTTCPLCRLSLLDKGGSFHETRSQSGGTIQGESSLTTEGNDSEIGDQDNQASRSFGTEVVISIPDRVPGQPSQRGLEIRRTNEEKIELGASRIADKALSNGSSRGYAAPGTSSPTSSKSQSRISRRFRRSHSTGHCLAKGIKSETPTEGSSYSVAFCLPLLASDFGRSRSYTAALSRPWSGVAAQEHSHPRQQDNNSFSWRKGGGMVARR